MEVYIDVIQLASFSLQLHRKGEERAALWERFSVLAFRATVCCCCPTGKEL